MKWIRWILAAVTLLLLMQPGVGASAGLDGLDGAFDLDEQLDAIGRDELMQEVPGEARELMEQSGVGDLSVDQLLQLSPKDFFRTVWDLLLQQMKKPLRTLGVIAAVVVLCAMLGGLGTSVSEQTLPQMFHMVAVLCILTSVILPILDCIVNASGAIKDVSVFMLGFIPVFAAALTAAGQPVTGAAYNLFLFSTCQAVSQVVAQTLIPLLGIYLALCVVGVLVPDLRIASATKTIKSILSWALGLVVTVFVGLLSLQTMVGGSADSVTARTAKFLIGSFVPVVGGTLSEAFSTAQGCLRLIKTSVGTYGILVALFTFLPVLLQTVCWYLVTGVASIAGDILGVGRVSEVMRSCSTVLGILLAVILSFALLVIVSTAVVTAAGLNMA